jgi:hypothetical protein
MSFAPRQDWALFRELTRQADADWLRRLTVDERFEMYCDLFNIVREARQGPGDWEKLDRWAWEQKVALRLRMVEAYQKLDELRRERTAADHTG